MQTLKSLNWRGTSAAFFSPDGRFLLYDAPATDTDLNRDVFLIAVDGSRESTIAHPKDDRVAGWSPHGRSVLFISDRRGSNDLWRQAVSDGRPTGTPELVVPEVGTVRVMGVTNSGALYLNRSVGGPDVETIGVDFVAGRQTTASVRPIASNVGFNRRPAWSPDGKSLLAMLGDPILVVHSMETGRDRELSLVADLTWIAGPSWSPDGRQIAVIGNDMKGRHGVFRIDAATGAVTPVTFTGSRPTTPAGGSPMRGRCGRRTARSSTTTRPAPGEERSSSGLLGPAGAFQRRGS